MKTFKQELLPGLTVIIFALLLVWTFFSNEPGQLGLKAHGAFETREACEGERRRQRILFSVKYGYNGTWWISPECNEYGS